MTKKVKIILGDTSHSYIVWFSSCVYLYTRGGQKFIIEFIGLNNIGPINLMVNLKIRMPLKKKKKIHLLVALIVIIGR